MTKALVVLSGGQDSTTCLYHAKRFFSEVHAVTFDYGQRHRIETQSAHIIASLAGVMTHELIHVPGILAGTSPLVNQDQTLEQYKDWQSLPGGLEKTFVPMRNQLFLTIAANRAICLGARTLITGVSGEDFGGYPDCRQPFIDAMALAIRKGTFVDEADEIFSILTPLMHLNKKETVDMSVEMPGCYGALAFSHTAYDGRYPPVGQDHATLLRAKGFFMAGVPDPLIVRAHWEGVMDLPDTDNYNQWRDRIAAASPFGIDIRLGDMDGLAQYASIIAEALEKMIRG